MDKLRQIFFKILTPIVLCFLNMFGCLFGSNEMQYTTADVNGSLACTDALGRSVTSAGNKSEKLVGVFYFLWMGQYGDDTIRDISKIVEAHPDAILSEENWLAAGGGDQWDFHFWGEPLFGYYRSDDKWVVRKHLQMLTDAGVDFLVFDTTNQSAFIHVAEVLIDVWHEYLVAGWDVPQLVFYTNYDSGIRMNELYDGLYNNEALYEKYPRLEELWFKMDGKPMIVGLPDDEALRDDVKDYFRIKTSQWPNEAKERDGFPWMEFDRTLTLDAVYNDCGTKIMSVSAAQHADTGAFSPTAWYGANDRTRSWHNGKNDTSENGMLYGYNFAEQWEFALKMNPDIIFITGFNEWVAQRLPANSDAEILFVDCATENCSRDVEPSAGALGDNYYLQMVDYIRKFKNSESAVAKNAQVAMDIDGGFEQWENSEITAKYRDYQADTADRNSLSHAYTVTYTDTSGRNDIVNMKVTEDAENYYFYVDTAENLTSCTDENWMTLFINNEYIVNRTSPADGKTKVEKRTDAGYESIGEAQIRFAGNQLMLQLPKDMLASTGSLQFKWADNCNPDDVYSFYTKGDAAPLGRLCYVY